MAKKTTRQIKILDSYHLTIDEYDYLINFFNSNKTQLEPQEQKQLLFLYNKMFKTNRQPTQCVPCWIEMLEALHKIYIEFNDNSLTTK